MLYHDVSRIVIIVYHIKNHSVLDNITISVDFSYTDTFADTDARSNPSEGGRATKRRTSLSSHALVYITKLSLLVLKCPVKRS